MVLANPLNSGADEQAQTIKAAAAARLQLKGFRTNAVGYSAGGVPVYFYKLPNYYEGISPSYKMLLCELGFPDQALCHESWLGASYNGYSSSYVGSYQPVYDFVIGIPTLFLSGNSALYSMQLLSGALCCFALSLSLSLFFHRRRSKYAKGLVVMGLTPVLIYYCTQVNPSGFEMCFGFLEWCSGLYLLDLINSFDFDRVQKLSEFKYTLITFWLAVIILISSRPDSFAIALAIFATILGVTGSKKYNMKVVLKLFKSRLIYLAVFFLIFNLEWIRLNPFFIPGNIPERTLYHYGNFGHVLNRTIHGQLERINLYSQLFNGINYLTTKIPIIYFAAYLIVLGGSLIIAFRFSNKKQAIYLTLMVIGVFVVIIVYDQIVFSRLELGFQFRYILPFEVGLPILISDILDRHSGKGDIKPVFHRLADSNLALWTILSLMLGGFIETFYYDWKFQLFTAISAAGKTVLINTWTPPDGFYGSIGFELLAITIFILSLRLVLRLSPILPEENLSFSKPYLQIKGVEND